MAFSNTVSIGSRDVGADHPAMIVAEIGPNHDGSIERALTLIDLASEAGCDAVKFQYRKASEELFDRGTRSYYYDEPRYEFIERVQEFEPSEHRHLRDYAASKNLTYICSAMSEYAIGCIVDLEADALKIPSGESGNPWLLESAGKCGLPVIASSGMSPSAEIDAMIEALGRNCQNLVLLHCVSEYPTRMEDMNLRYIAALSSRFGCPVGISDHSRNIPEVAAAVALGASMIEVHFTDDRDRVGPDHSVSLLPQEMKKLVTKTRNLEAALGRAEKILGEHVTEVRQTFTNSIVTARAVEAGEELVRSNLALKKPATGLDPSNLPKILGQRAVRYLPANHPIGLEDIK